MSILRQNLPVEAKRTDIRLSGGATLAVVRDAKGKIGFRLLATVEGRSTLLTPLMEPTETDLVWIGDPKADSQGRQIKITRPKVGGSFDLLLY